MPRLHTQHQAIDYGVEQNKFFFYRTGGHSCSRNTIRSEMTKHIVIATMVDHFERKRPGKNCSKMRIRRSPYSHTLFAYWRRCCAHLIKFDFAILHSVRMRRHPHDLYTPLQLALVSALIWSGVLMVAGNGYDEFAHQCSHSIKLK